MNKKRKKFEPKIGSVNLFRNFFSETINKYRPPEPEPVILKDESDKEEVKLVPNRSPVWQKSTKQIVIVCLAILSLIALIIFRNMIGPLIFALILTYLLQPVVFFFARKLKISWKSSVLLVYLFLSLILIGLLAGGSIYIVSQVQNLLNFLISIFEDIPSNFQKYLVEMQTKSLIPIDVTSWINSDLNSQLSDNIQVILQKLGGGLGGAVTSAASKVGWFFFIIGFSFFLVWESDDAKKPGVKVKIKGYEFDIMMAKFQLSRIWNGFLRGQIALIGLTTLIYWVIYLVLGMNYSLALAVAAGLTRLVPYVGSFAAWGACGLVALFQGHTIFGLSPTAYVVLTVGIAFLMDKFLDGFVAPKFLADTLKIHPAMVLIFAIICARMIGILGIFLAAPVVATLKLALTYVYRKLNDDDPWEGIETIEPAISFSEAFAKVQGKAEALYRNVKEKISMKTGWF